MLALLLVIAQLQAPEFRPGKLIPDSPDDAAYAAAIYLQKALDAEYKAVNKPAGQPHASNLRFISLYNLSTHGTRRKLGSKTNEVEQYSPLDEMVKVLLFAINHTNRVNPPATLIRVTDDLFAIHYDSPGWTAKAWEDMAAKDAYFRAEWIQDDAWTYLTAWTYSEHPIMRADQFVVLSTIAPDYYSLMGVPKTEAEFYKLIGTDEKFLTEFSRIKASIKTDGLTVTFNNRILDFLPGAFDLWRSNDVINSKGKKNALRQLGVVGGDIHQLDVDGREFVYELNNGLDGFYLANAKGERVDSVPNNIAGDDNFRDHTVFAARSCITCHVSGLHPAESDQAKLLENQVITLRTINPKDARDLENRYDERAAQRAIRTGQENYRSAVESIVGVQPERMTPMYASAWRGYAEERVTLHMAALEAGLSDDGLVAVLQPSVDPNLLYLIQAPGRSIARDVLEDVFSQIMLLKGKPAPKQGRAKLPEIKPALVAPVIQQQGVQR